MNKFAKLSLYVALGAILVYAIAGRQLALLGVMTIALPAFILWKRRPKERSMRLTLWVLLITTMVLFIFLLSYSFAR